MAKPRKKRQQSTRAPKQPQPETATEATSEDTSPAAATSDEQVATVASETSAEGTEPNGDQEVATSQEEPATEPTAESEPATETEDDGSAAHEPAEVTEELKPEPSDDEQRVKLGPVEGRMRHIRLDVVCGILGEAMSQRVEVLRGVPSIEAVQKRMLATDGRATPVVFVESEDVTVVPTLFHGVEAIAAALNLGKETVPVILIRPGDAGEAQSALVELARQQQKPEASDEDDDLYVQVLTYYDA